MATYATNADLVLDTGEEISDFLNSELSDVQITSTLDNARNRAYKEINGIHLLDKTLTPASLVSIPALAQIEIDIVLANILAGSFSAGTKRKLPNKFYRDRAETALKNLKYPATADTPVTGAGNVGDGTISIITVNDDITITEQWTLIALDASNFKVRGTHTKNLIACEVDVDYPDITEHGRLLEDYGMQLKPVLDYGDFPIYFKISAGATAFAEYDKFTFKTFASSKPKKQATELILA